MRYIRKDVIVDAWKIASVGPHRVSHAASVGVNDAEGAVTHAAGGTAIFTCTLENGEEVILHAGSLGFVVPQVGDYYVAGGTFAQKKAFEQAYSAEVYGAADGE